MSEKMKLEIGNWKFLFSSIFLISNFKFLLSFLLLAFYFSVLLSCKAKKNLPHTSVQKTTKCKLEHKNAKTLAALLKKNQLAYSTLNGKIKANVVMDEKSTAFTVALRMQKDSIIWASISPALGIEVLRLIATKDSLKFIDRIHNQYFIGDYDTLSKILYTPVDLEVLQSLLIGNSVEFYEEDEKLRASVDSCSYLLGTIRKRKLRKVIQKGKELREPAQNIWLTDSAFKISRILFHDFETRREFDAQFQNFQSVSMPDGEAPRSIPFTITYIIKAGKTIAIDLEYSKVSANKSQTFPFSIPEGYERIARKDEK